MVSWQEPRTWRKTDLSLNSGSFHSLCVPGHVTLLSKSQFPLLGNTMGLPLFIGRVKSQDIHKCLTQRSTQNWYFLPMQAWLPRKWSSQYPCPQGAFQFTGAYGNVHFYMKIHSSLGHLNRSSKACEWGTSHNMGWRAIRGVLPEARGHIAWVKPWQMKGRTPHQTTWF